MPEPSSSTLTDTLAEIATNFGPWLIPGAIVGSALIGATVAVLAIWHQRAIARKRAMIDALLTKNWDRNYIEARSEFVRLRDDRAALLEAAKLANAEGDDASTIRSILNDYEITALGIKRGILDEKIFKLWFRTSFLDDHEKLKSYIEEIRRRNRRAYVELEELADKWKGQRD